MVTDTLFPISTISRELEPDAPLLSDNLAVLLKAFSGDDLRALVGILREHRSWSPFRATRAYEAHGLPAEADLAGHTEAIAEEILWWGGNDIGRELGRQANWRSLVSATATRVGVPKQERSADRAVWKIESSIIQRTMSDFNRDLPQASKKAVSNARALANVVRTAGGSVATVVGIAARAGGPELLAGIAARGAATVAATTIVAPIVAVAGALWTAYDLAGPGHRVVQPVVLTIALARRRLRDARCAAAFRD